MDEYLQCLYDYILEVRRDETLLKRSEFQRLRRHLLQAVNIMEDSLTKEQQEIVDDMLSIQAKMSILENEWLFQESIALGKWMAQV